jgi:hypothetical protein
MDLKALIGFCLAITTGSAALADNLTTLATLSGKCNAAMAMDVRTDPSLCINKVVNVELPNGRKGFLFNLRRSGEKQISTISFFGDGRKQRRLDPGTALQPIDRVHFTFGGVTDDLVAAGACRFSDPYNGTKAKVSCMADTNQGTFAGDFLSNGRPPNMSQTR